MDVPAKLKAVAHYLKIGNEHAGRDPVIHYWYSVVRTVSSKAYLSFRKAALYAFDSIGWIVGAIGSLYACQTAMKLDKTSPECKQFLTGLLNTLEKAHIEECALKLFYWADAEDRASRFDKNVVKAFYTAGHLFDVLQLFDGEVDEAIVRQKKYAKVKAAYIHNCLKNGETPISGPLDNAEMDAENNMLPDNAALNAGTSTGANTGSYGFTNHSTGHIAVPPSIQTSDWSTAASALKPATESLPNLPSALPTSATAGTSLSTADFVKIQRLCKEASSALDYEDVPTAVEKLEKSLRMLKTGKAE